MNKRLLTAMCAVALLAAVAPAHAAKHKRYSEGGAGTSRSCLTSAARALLNRIEAKFGRMQIVSTCRPGARIAGTNKISRHASGNAIDFNAGGRKGAVVQWLIANHKSGGTMTYAAMNHIHVDVGHHFVALNSGGHGGYRSSRRRYASASSRRHRSASYRSRFEGRSALGMGNHHTRASERGG